MGDEKEEKNKEKGGPLSFRMPFFVPAVKKGPFSFSWQCGGGTPSICGRLVPHPSLPSPLFRSGRAERLKCPLPFSLHFLPPWLPSEHFQESQTAFKNRPVHSGPTHWRGASEFAGLEVAAAASASFRFGNASMLSSAQPLCNNCERIRGKRRDMGRQGLVHNSGWERRRKSEAA